MMQAFARGPTYHLRKMVVASHGVPFQIPLCQLSSHHKTKDYHCKNYHTFLRRQNASSLTVKRYSSTEPVSVYEHILDSTWVHSAQSVFTFCHDMTELHWAGSIALATLALRFTLTFPMAIYSQNIRAKVEKVQPEIIGRAKYVFSRKYGHRMKEEKWSETKARRFFLGVVKQQSKEVYIKENCHPAKGSILLLTQLPLWITLSLALRNMTGAFSQRFYTDPAYIISELSTSGALWFPDLTVPDQYMVLPILVGLLNLANIEMHALHKGRVSTFQRRLNHFLRGVSVLMIPIATYMPSSIVLYWVISAMYSFGQNIVLRLPTVRRALRMKTSKTDSDTPFQDMKEVFMQRYIHKRKDEDKLIEQVDEILKSVGEEDRKSRPPRPK